MLTFLVFLIILSVLVMIHEAGHYFVARWLGIKVEEFGWGIPPRLWGKKIGETIYSINWLPVGGFVKLFGEDDAGAGRLSAKSGEQSAERNGAKRLALSGSAELKRAFFARPVWQRAAVVIAGVVMNAVLAFVIYYAFLSLSGYKTELPLLTDHRFFGVEQTNRLEALIVTEVLPDSPAAEAELTPCTEESCLQLVSLAGQKFETVAGFREILEDSEGESTVFVFKDLAMEQEKEFTITPRVDPEEGQGALGIKFSTQEMAVLDYATPTQRLFSGIVHPANVMVYQFEILGRLIGASFEQRSVQPVGNAFAGPVGIFVVTGEVLQIPDGRERLLAILNLAGLLSATLAVFNILPIPALDGGRLFFIIIEGVTGRKVDQRLEAAIHSIGMMILLGLILLISFNDVFKFFL